MFTNVYYDTKSNTIHLWEQVNGERLYNQVHWVPYVFIPDREGKFKTIEGMPVSKKTFDTYRSYKNFQENTRCYENQCIPSIQYLAERYYRIDDDDLETPDLKVYSLDIEVHCESGGFPSPDNANHPIVLISVNDYKQDITYTFGLHPYTGNNGYKVKYWHCEDEETLLQEFLNWWHRNPPDVVTGWNIVPDNKMNRNGGFDLPYLVNRITELLDENETRKLSPIGIVRSYQQQDSEAIHVTIAGVSILDYLALYKWYSPENPENYKLQTISYNELSKGKLDYSEYLGLKDFYHMNWNKYVEYNIEDTHRVSELEQKLGYIRQAQALSLLCKTPMEKYNATTQLIEGLLLTHYRRNDLCAPYFAGGDKEWFPAAYVKEPAKGLHDWNIDIDITSSYPTHIIVLNMSFETFYGRIKGLNEEKIVEGVRNKQFKKPFVLSVPESPSPDKVSHTGIPKHGVEISGDKLRKFNKLLQKGLLSIAPCGSCFVNNKKGVFSTIEHNVFNKRKQKKSERNEVGKAAASLVDSQEKKRLEEKKARLDSYQNALKIVINGAFGITGVPYSRYFNRNISEAITSCGRHTIRSGEKFINEWFQEGIWYENEEFCEVLNEISDSWKYKEIKEDMVAAIDTDSCDGSSEIIVDGKRQTVEDYYSELPDEYEYYDDFNEFYIKKGIGTSPSVSNGLELQNKQVNYVMKHKVKKKMYKIKVEGKEVVITEDHSIMVYRDNELISVKPYDIKKNDYIVKLKGSDIELTNNFEIEEIGEQEQWVYDLEIEDNHNFFANDILLHNSLFIRFGHFLNEILMDSWKSLEDDRKTDIVIRLSKIIENYIDDRSYNEIQVKDYNSVVPKEDFSIRFKQEIVCKSALYLKKKKYGFHVVNKEGMPMDKISVTGLEIVRSETPSLFREALVQLLEMILKNENDDKIVEIVDHYKKKARKSSPYELATNMSVNNMGKYIVDDGKNITHIKGTPYHVKGTANYMNLLRHLGLENKYPQIHEGDKAKVIYLKENPYMMDVLTFDVWPEEFEKEGIVYDANQMIEKFFIRKIEFLLSPMGKESILKQNKNINFVFGGMT